MKKVICLILVLIFCTAFVCTAYAATDDGSFVPSPGVTEPDESCEHEHTSVVGQKDPTCTRPGYTGDTVCDHCGKVIEEGEAIPPHGHHFEDGKCTICGVDEDNPQTGDSSNIFLWIAVMVAALVALVAVTVGYRKKLSNR